MESAPDFINFSNSKFPCYNKYMDESPIINLKLNLSTSEIIGILGTGKIIKINNFGYILNLHTMEQSGNNPITGAEIVIPAKSNPELLDPKIYIDLEDTISNKNLEITACDLLRNSDFPLQENNHLYDIDNEIIGSLCIFQKRYREYQKDGQLVQVSSEMISRIIFSKSFKAHLKEKQDRSLVIESRKDEFDEDKVIIDNISFQNI